MIQTLANSFEANYPRIVGLFKYEPSGKTVVHVYSNKNQFQKMIGRSTEGTYVAEENIIKVYTPSSFSNQKNEDEYTFQVIHEFIHAVIQQINPAIGQVKFLDEGIAYYVSNQLEAELQTRTNFADIPTFEQLSSPEYFDKSGHEAYFFSGTIVRYISNKYGVDALNELIKNPEQIEQILNISLNQLYEQWSEDLRK
ncbi:hypothetical protein KCTCHS21_03610 [Cohnella abietis]|uniref:Peptidase MA-like domain-containing protein n=2 Tax=Cohnella abietis TaxID=2507935 RepID=A0A3T1CYM4_9BACL|nr:hypothetical protein KCTCHS21_03610 [Cohnella abietis]